MLSAYIYYKIRKKGINIFWSCYLNLVCINHCNGHQYRKIACYKCVLSCTSEHVLLRRKQINCQCFYAVLANHLWNWLAITGQDNTSLYGNSLRAIRRQYIMACSLHVRDQYLDYPDQKECFLIRVVEILVYERHMASQLSARPATTHISTHKLYLEVTSTQKTVSAVF